MRKAKIYLDTSVINYLDAPHMPRQMQDTLKLWDILATNEKYEVVLSNPIEREVFACSEPKLSILAHELANFTYFLASQTEAVIASAEEYIQFVVAS